MTSTTEPAETGAYCAICGCKHDADGYCRDCGDGTPARPTARVCSLCGGPHGKRNGRGFCAHCGDYTPSSRYMPRATERPLF